MIDAEILVDDDDFRRAMAKFRLATGASLRETVTTAAKFGMRRVIDHSPPQGTGVTKSAAKKALEQRIARDYHVTMVPVKIKNRRKEKFPDVQFVLDQNPLRIRKGKAMRQYQHARKYVSQVKFNRSLKAAKARVGKLASGWVSVGAYLKIAVAKWISRHGPGEGTVAHGGTDETFFIDATNNNAHLKGTHHGRLMDFAIESGTRNLEQYAEKIIRGRMRKAGIAG